MRWSSNCGTDSGLRPWQFNTEAWAMLWSHTHTHTVIATISTACDRPPITHFSVSSVQCYNKSEAKSTGCHSFIFSVVCVDLHLHHHQSASTHSSNGNITTTWTDLNYDIIQGKVWNITGGGSTITSLTLTCVRCSCTCQWIKTFPR